MWGFDKESPLHTFFVGEPMAVVAASPDGSHFAAGSVTGAAYVWEVSTGRLVRTWPAHFKAVSAMAFASEGSALVTAGEDTVVSAWSLATLLDPARADELPVPMHTWSEHALPVTAVAIGRGGAGGAAIVASASADRSVKLFSLAGGAVLRAIELPVALGAVAIDACESTLYAGGQDGRVFEVPLNAAPGTVAGSKDAARATTAGAASSAGAALEGHSGAITAVACTADGLSVVSTSEDGTCRVWDAASRQTTHVLKQDKGAPLVALVAAPRWRVAGVGAGGGAEKRKLAPLAPFSRFADSGGANANAWEGAPIVLRGGGLPSVPKEGGREGREGLEGRDGREGGEAKRPRRDGPAGEDEDENDAAALRARLDETEAALAKAKKDTEGWRQRHDKLRAYIAEELVRDPGGAGD